MTGFRIVFELARARSNFQRDEIVSVWFGSTDYVTAMRDRRHQRHDTSFWHMGDDVDVGHWKHWKQYREPLTKE